MNFKKFAFGSAAVGLVYALFTQGALFVLAKNLDPSSYSVFYAGYTYYLVGIPIVQFGSVMYLSINYRKGPEYAVYISFLLKKISPLIFIFYFTFLIVVNNKMGIIEAFVFASWSYTSQYFLLLQAKQRIDANFSKLIRQSLKYNVAVFLPVVAYSIFSGQESSEVIWFVALGVLVSFLYSLLSLRKEIDLDVKGKVGFDEFKKNYRRSLAVVLSTSSTTFFATLDRVAASNVLLPEDFEKYAVISLVAGTALFVVNNFAVAWGAYLAKFDLLNKEIYRSQLKKQFYLLLLPVVWLVGVAFQFALYSIVFSVGEIEVLVSISIVSFAYMFYCAGKFYLVFMNLTSKNLFVVFTNVISILSLVVILSVFKTATVNTIATAYLFSSIVYFLANMIRVNFESRFF